MLEKRGKICWKCITKIYYSVPVNFQLLLMLIWTGWNNFKTWISSIPTCFYFSDLQSHLEVKCFLCIQCQAISIPWIEIQCNVNQFISICVCTTVTWNWPDQILKLQLHSSQNSIATSALTSNFNSMKWNSMQCELVYWYMLALL